MLTKEEVEISDLSGKTEGDKTGDHASQILVMFSAALPQPCVHGVHARTRVCVCVCVMHVCVHKSLNRG